MDHDSPDSPKIPAPPSRRRGSTPAGQNADLPPEGLATGDIDPATVASEEDDEARLPEAAEEVYEAVAEGPLAIGHAAIENAGKLAPTPPGASRMVNGAT